MRPARPAANDATASAAKSAESAYAAAGEAPVPALSQSAQDVPPDDVDPDATDPNWLPPVDTDLSALIPVRRPLPDLSWLGRVAVPLLLVSVGGYAAFSVVGALSSRVPAVASVDVAASAELTAEPAAAVQTGEASAAQLLLDQAQARSGTGEEPEAPEADGESPQLDAQITELPRGVALGGDKGLLEVNSGDRHKIYVAGVFVGRGPARRVPLAPGLHEVRTRLGGADRTYQVTIEVGKRTRLEPTRATAGR
jgi:hypothetical protein